MIWNTSQISFNDQENRVFLFFFLPETLRFQSHRADLLPLSIQFGLLVGLFEASRFPALGHLDPVLEGCPAGTGEKDAGFTRTWPFCVDR